MKNRTQRLTIFTALWLLGGFALVGTNNSVFAATDTTSESSVQPSDIDTMVITATRIKENSQEVPANITSVSGTSIRDKHYASMSDVLRDVSGVQIGDYGSGVGYNTANTFYLNGSNNVVWMVDGIEMNNTQTPIPLKTLVNMDNIKRVEVLKGAASALYGSNAVGGVVNIITEEPEEGIHSKLRFSLGSFGQRQEAFINEGKEDKLDWRFSYQHDRLGDYKDGHGNKVPTYLSSNNASAHLGYDVDDNNHVSLTYDNYRESERHSDTNKHIGTMLKGDSKNESLRGIWDSNINDRLSSKFTLFRNTYNSKFTTFYDPYTYTPYDITTKGIGEQLTYTLEKHKIVGGFEWRQDELEKIGNATDTEHKITNSAYYLQDEWQFAPKWTLIPGVRVDHHSTFGTHTSPHATLQYMPNENTNIYTSYNRFFVAPTAYQLYGLFGSNPDLNPETGYEWQLGVKHKFDKTFTANLNVFRRQSHDRIGWFSDYSLPSYGIYRNIAEEKASGVNIDLQKRFNNHWSSSLGYTYTHVDAASNQNDNLNGYLPKHAINLGVDYMQDKLDAHVNVRGIIDRPGPLGATTKAYPKDSYWLTDLSANYRPTDDLTIFGRVNNIFDVYYAERTSVGQYGSQAGEWWAAPGRSFQLGVEYSF